ncbi:hypothetical protein C8Q77DRAFT_1154039 [Trametes polyzona]|nr:hypothetical protein C8Q77DRAFT_1154039 [Trametes polyzona]
MSLTSSPPKAQKDTVLFPHESGTPSESNHTKLVTSMTLSTSPAQPESVEYAATAPTPSADASSSGTCAASSTAVAPDASASTSGRTSSRTNVGPVASGAVGRDLRLLLLLGPFCRYFRHYVARSGGRRGGRGTIPAFVEDLRDGGEGGRELDTKPSSTADFIVKTSSSAPWRHGDSRSASTRLGSHDSKSKKRLRVPAGLGASGVAGPASGVGLSATNSRPSSRNKRDRGKKEAAPPRM